MVRKSGPGSKELLAELKNYRHKSSREQPRRELDLWVMNARRIESGQHHQNTGRRRTVRGSRDERLVSRAMRSCESKRRNLYYMKIDGTERIKIADNAREPCWSADGKKIAFLKGEFENFSYLDMHKRTVYYD